MTSIVPNDLLAESSPAWSRCGSEASNVRMLLAEPKSPLLAGRGCGGVGDAPAGGGTGGGGERPPRPRGAPPGGKPAPPPRAARGGGAPPAVRRPGQRRSVSEGRHPRSPRRKERLG